MSRPGRRPPSPPADGQVCTLVAVDIAGFTRPDRDDDIRRYLHEELYRVLQKAFDGSGIPWARCWYEDRGDVPGTPPVSELQLPHEVIIPQVLALLPSIPGQRLADPGRCCMQARPGPTSMSARVPRPPQRRH
jgi:hypothetical protein